MGVGPEGVLLTSHLYPCTQSMVPYPGDNELGATWPDPEDAGWNMGLGLAGVRAIMNRSFKEPAKVTLTRPTERGRTWRPQEPMVSAGS
jgi:hypothetical protein